MEKNTLRQTLRTGTIPLLLLLLLGAGFGLLIPWLGYYWDDWPVLFMTRLQGAEGLLDFYQYDRPFSAWTYLVSAPLLDSHAWAWHVFTLLLRWLTALGLWWCLRGLWPERPHVASWTALLFAIYPAFTQQSIAVAFSQHWTCYALYFLSLGAMIAAVRRPRRAIPYTLLGVLSMLVNSFTMEYFLGLELLRPVLLWFMSGEPGKDQSVASRLRRVFLRWLPYLLGLLVFIVWRLFFLELADDDPNRPVVLLDLLSRPLSTLLGLAQTAVQDSLHILIASWYEVLEPISFDLSDRFLLIALAVGLLCAAATAWVMSRRSSEEQSRPAEPDSERAWLVQAAMLGLLGLVLGPLPAWLTGKQALVGLYGSRFALPAMFGASLLIVAFLEWLTPRRVAKTAILSVLIGLAVVFHLRTGNEYRWNWTEQSRFYWQLAWRAPSLEAGTALFSEGELFKWVGGYSTSMGINLLYPRQDGDPDVSYWFVDLENNFVQNREGLLQGIPIKQNFRSFEFRGQSQDSLVIVDAPAREHCLWVLGPDDLDNPALTELTRQVAAMSNLDRISAESRAGYPPAEIFGPEPQHTWCYYYQKAELNRQLGEWENVASLGDQAIESGAAPNDEQEWLPFIEAYAHTGRWDRAQSLTETVAERTKYHLRLCALWDRIAAETPGGTEQNAALQNVRSELACTQP